MFGRGEVKAVEVTDESRSRDQKELDQLRKEKAEREAEERRRNEQRAADKYKNRTWVNEGNGTNIQSLEIDGGKLWRINNQMYFQPITTTTNYYQNTYSSLCGLGSYTSTSAGALQRL